MSHAGERSLEPPESEGGCAVHREMAALFRCTSCGGFLCEECVDVGKHLILCRLCGERALPLPGTPDPTREDPRPAAVTLALDPASLLTHHVIVPGAIIAMVTALLFFLVDVRSVFLPLGSALKWLGFWFVFATVLIARYGKLAADRERQGCYTVALSMALAVVLAVQPWEKRSTEPLDMVINLAIFVAVWRFATRVTVGLSREGEETGRPTKKHRIYGVERLELEAWEDAQEDPRIVLRRQRRESAPSKALTEKKGAKADAHGNPSATVAPLIAIALVVFALGEPFLLAGPPEVGERALLAVVVFLFSSALVLAAGAAVGTLRHARRLEGEVSERLVASRVFGTGLLMIVLLAVALAVPGVTYRGSGELERREALEGLATDPGEEAFRNDTENDLAKGGATEENPPEPAGTLEEDARARTPQGQRTTAPQSSNKESSTRAGQGQGASGQSDTGRVAEMPMATSMLRSLASLGRVLVLPLIIALILGGLYVLSRLAPILATMKLSGFAGFLQRLSAALGRRKKEKKSKRRGLSADLDLDGLSDLSPREAVVTGYTRLLGALEDVGHVRERETPYELLAGLPSHLRRIQKPLEKLTSLYVIAAYGKSEIEERSRREAISFLAEIQRQLPSERSFSPQ